MRAILFDFGGTLDADGVPWSARFYAAYVSRGGILSAPTFNALFQDADRRVERHEGIRSLGFRATLELQATLLADLLIEDIDASALAAAVHADTLPVVERNRILLVRLAADWPLGIVSNFSGNLEPCLEELDLRAPFGVVCDSSILGVAKPDPRIFQHALAALGCRPAGAWMVGDNPYTDLLPAARLGMCTCWIAPVTDLRSFGPTLPTMRIGSLERFTKEIGVPCTV